MLSKGVADCAMWDTDPCLFGPGLKCEHDGVDRQRIPWETGACPTPHQTSTRDQRWGQVNTVRVHLLLGTKEIKEKYCVREQNLQN